MDSVQEISFDLKSVSNEEFFSRNWCPRRTFWCCNSLNWQCSRCPLVTTVSRGAQEIFRLLPHSFVKPSDLPRLYDAETRVSSNGHVSRRDEANFKVYGCVVESRDMVAPNDPQQLFDKVGFCGSSGIISHFHGFILFFSFHCESCLLEWKSPFLIFFKVCDFQQFYDHTGAASVLRGHKLY